MNARASIAKLNLSKGDVALLLRGSTLQVKARLEDVSVTDESTSQPKDHDFKKIVSREGDHFADFEYETFDPADKENFPGVNSVVKLKTAALKVTFLEQPLHEIYIFLLKLARLKGIYDAAAQAAVQSVSEITRMRFEVLVRSPVIVFPKDPSTSQDALIMKLGEISARNHYDGPQATTEASLQGIGLTSQSYIEGNLSILKMIDDVHITTTVLQVEGIDHSAQVDTPDTKVFQNIISSKCANLYKIDITISDIKLGLTQRQYCDLYVLSQAVTRVVTTPPELNPSPQTETALTPAAPKTGALNSTAKNPSSEALIDLEPEIPLSSRHAVYATLDLQLSVKTIKLQLFDEKATTEESLRNCGIARFALQDNTVRYKSLSNGGGEAEVILKSFTLTNTRPGNSKFREIIPAAKHDRNQFMVLFTMTGGKESSSLAIVTIESPKFLFTLDPIFALGNFFMSALTSSNKEKESVDASKSQVTTKATVETAPPPPSENAISFRVDLNDVSVTILESDTDINSQALQLSVQQVMMSQQVCIDVISCDYTETPLGHYGTYCNTTWHVLSTNG